jgi:cobalt-zinc-cadmium efflux system protein
VSRTRRLLIVLTLNLALVAGLVIVGITAHSLAVLAEGGDYLLDAAGVGVALLAIRLAGRPASRTRPAGRPAPADIAALVNAGWLLILDRLISHTPQVDGLPVLIVSGIAALMMTAGAFILHRDGAQAAKQERDLSVAAVLLDTIADAAAAAGVALTGAIIAVTGGWYWLDPAVALTIAVVIAYHALALIRKVVSQVRHTAAGGAISEAPGTTQGLR